jgi:deoxyribonucleoside regulator
MGSEAVVAESHQPDQESLLGIDATRHQLLANVASMYYESELNQNDIAEELGISRSSVSRLLSEAREQGVVNITIRWPTSTSRDLTAELSHYFPEAEVHVIQGRGHGYSQIVEMLGRLAARLLEQKLKDNMILGISWNTGVYQVVRAFRAARRLGVRVIQLTGSAGVVNPLLDGPDLARWLAQMLGGQYLYLPAPLVVDSTATRDALLNDRTISERLELAAQADIALVGIGTVFPPLSSLFQIGYMNDEELATIATMGGVGDILTTFYDIEGRILPLEFHERIIGLPLEKLRDIDGVIGVAAGEEKAAAIIGALTAGYVDCLVTDDNAALRVLSLLNEHGAQ